jgi:A/G-specific adenine glycosylase
VPAAAALLDWYAASGRDLPWRRTRDPYAVLVSEVMLQQTQVARVVPRYEAWLERWPTARALAGAPLADVLREWVGLGYNRRAVRLWEACRIVASSGWPDDLRALPGVGPYTADAVQAFAHGREVVPVDTNVRRVFARLGRSIATPPTPAELGHALMDLGATICTARAPRCGECPVAAWCDGPEPAAPRRAGARVRFEDTDRYARGRVVAALAAGEPLPALDDDRLERALAGLERDGLVVRDGGTARLP